MATAMQRSAWILPLAPSPQTRLRLFCLPYAGGGAAIFHKWRGSLPADVELLPIQLPGRESRWKEPAYTAIKPLVQSLAEALRPYCDLPFAFFGHSMGALISFELIRELRRAYGVTPLHLFVSAHRAPQLPDHEPAFYHLPEPAFVEKIRQLNGTPDEILQNADLMALMLPTLRADFTLCDTYTYAAEPPLACPITAFGGVHDTLAYREQLLAWREQTCAAFKLRMLPGGHFFIHSARVQLLWFLEQELRQITDRLHGENRM